MVEIKGVGGEYVDIDMKIVLGVLVLGIIKDEVKRDVVLGEWMELGL